MDDVNKKIKELEYRISQLETRRILQQDIIPGSIKMRHISEGVPYIRSGLVADKPTSGEASMQGSPVYFATDTDTLYIWNGTTWVSEVLT